MVGGTIRRKVIHRESFRASVLHPSEIQAVLQSIAEKKCLLTTPSLLSRGTRRRQVSRKHALRQRRCGELRLAARSDEELALRQGGIQHTEPATGRISGSISRRF